MRVLTINTYGGSLLLGAKKFGADIIGSYEDAGFGQPIARANFPNVHHVEKWAEWPQQSLRDVVVLAHPPCSAFSVQNSSWNARGENADAFKCTRKVLDYVLPNQCAAVAIESVVGALGGAWYVHQDYADRYGYNLFRVLQNGCMFGVPQWRERFWVVYVRPDLAPPTMTWRLKPKWTRVRDAVVNEGPSVGNTDELLAALQERLWKKGLSRKQLDFLFQPQDPPHPTAGIAKIMLANREALGLDLGDVDPIGDVQRIYIGTGFTSGQLCYINPDGLAGTLLGSSWWYCNGRNMTEASMKNIMGFPTDYVFPDGRGSYRRNQRVYLSKGVIPHVATWILGNIATHTGMGSCKDRDCGACDLGYEITIQKNEIADFRFARKQWQETDTPALKHFQEEE